MRRRRKRDVEAKGLEYLLLISFLVLFVILVRYLSTPARKR
ncbi:MAG: hypothetical protein U0587_01150 [Candidatus Binatia bacterium]